MAERTTSGGPVTARRDGPTPYAVTFTLRLDDYVEALMWMNRRPGFAMARALRALVDMVVTVPSCGLLGYATAWAFDAGEWPDAAPFVVSGAIFGGIAAAFATEAMLRERRLRATLRRQPRAVPGVDRDDPQLVQQAGFTVTDYGVESRVPSRETRIPWDALLGLDETETLLLPHTSPRHWTVIPKRELTVEAVDRLRETIAGQLAVRRPATSDGVPIML